MKKMHTNTHKDYTKVILPPHKGKGVGAKKIE
jgi:hypothetical protein